MSMSWIDNEIFHSYFLQFPEIVSGNQSCREKTLKCINCRPFLIAICALVVIECACVLAELMIDLQGIKFRFENEEKEINRFVEHLKDKYPEVFHAKEIRSMADVINILEQSIVLRSPSDLLPPSSTCPCVCPGNVTSVDDVTTNMAGSSSISRSREIKSVQRLRTVPASDEIRSGLKTSGGSVLLEIDNSTKPTSFLMTSTNTTLPSSLTSVSSSPLLSPFQASSPTLLSSAISSSSHSSSTTSSLSFVPASDSPHFPSLTTFATSSSFSPTTVNSKTTDRHATLGLSHRSAIRRRAALKDRLNQSPLWRRGSISQTPVTYLTDPFSGSSTWPPDTSGSDALRSALRNEGTSHTSMDISTKSMLQQLITDNVFTHSLQDQTLLSERDISSGKAYGTAENKLIHNLFPVRRLLTLGFPASSASHNVMKDNPAYPARQPMGNSRSKNVPVRQPMRSVHKTPGHGIKRYLERHKRDVQTATTETWESSPSTQSVGSEVGTSTQTLNSNGISHTDSWEKFDPRTNEQNPSGFNGVLSTSSTLSTKLPPSDANKRTDSPLPLTLGTTKDIHAKSPAPDMTLVATKDTDSHTESSHDTTSIESFIPAAPQLLMQGSSSVDTSKTTNTSSPHSPVSLQDVFVLEINNFIDSFFLVAEFVPQHNNSNNNKFVQNNLEYSKIYKASKALHFISLSILSVMVLETAVKLFCTGCAFFKKKFEVFDAFIVVSSFALDFVFLDSRWYETGKDATTILVLLLPWRVVRIVNSFLMTMKHKHHLQMMNMKRAKKKAELKCAKMQTLLSEVRKDVQLLVALCRSNDVEEKDITSCLYGKGRRSVTLSAMSTCTSLMLISTLGKDAVQEDDIYGKLFKEALNEGDTSEVDEETLQAEEAAIDAAIELDEQIEARRKSRKYRKKALVKRSYTVPRRAASVEIPEPDINENNSNIFYINDGFLTTRATSPGNAAPKLVGNGTDYTAIPISGATAGCSRVDEESDEGAISSARTSPEAPPVPARSKYQSRASVKSLPRKGSRSNSMVVYVPEFDDEFEIPIKTPRKARRSLDLDSEKRRSK